MSDLRAQLPVRRKASTREVRSSAGAASDEPPPYVSQDIYDDGIVSGIDFGTTYSGVAWATNPDFVSDQINMITNWPGTGREEGKAPTELFYEDDQLMSGYEIPADADPVRWFKLLLLKEDDLSPDLKSSEFILRGRKMLKESGKTATDLIADYLKTLWKHTLQTITKARGESVVDALVFHVVTTVPAIWKGYARESMKQAAKKAGILKRRPAGATTLIFAPEPEAAALATLCEPGRRINRGEVYVICDAGGGTVDLISYKIDRSQPVSMHEAVEGKGGLCGGIFIDEAFEHMCKARLGRRWDRLSKAGIKEIMKGEWEQAIKPQFKPSNSKKEYIVSIPAEAFGKSSLDDYTKEPHMKNGRIHFKNKARSHLQKAFTDVFSSIIKLVNEQIRGAKDNGLSVKGIILVGGMGGSPYLYEHLVTQHKPSGIIVLQSGGMKPRTAICRGAVFKGFLQLMEDGTSNPEQASTAPITVTSTISRASFGTVYNVRLDKEKHHREDKVWDELQGIWKARNQMQWFLKRVENVSKKDPVREPFFRILKSDHNGSFGETMSRCEDEIPPNRRTSSVEHLCDIDYQLDVPFEDPEDYPAKNGEKCKKLSYEIEMVPSGASVEFAVYFNGRKQGAQNAQIKF